jgi:hypothetical protein
LWDSGTNDVVYTNSFVAASASWRNEEWAATAAKSSKGVSVATVKREPVNGGAAPFGIAVALTGEDGLPWIGMLNPTSNGGKGNFTFEDFSWQHMPAGSTTTFSPTLTPRPNDASTLDYTVTKPNNNGVEQQTFTVQFSQ